MLTYFFDEGAQWSFITEESADGFGRNCEQLSSIPSSKIYHKININKRSYTHRCACCSYIAFPLFNLQTEVKPLTYLKHLTRAHPTHDDNDENFIVSLLIGAEHYFQVVQNKIVWGNNPTAVKSKIGFLLLGSLPVNQRQSSSHVIYFFTTPSCTLDLEKFWKLESMGISSPETNSCTSSTLTEYIDEKISFQNGQYVAKLSWKDNHSDLQPTTVFTEDVSVVSLVG